MRRESFLSPAALGLALSLGIPAGAATAETQCEMLKRQYAACAADGKARLLPKGDFSYIMGCHDRFPYRNVCMSALPDGHGQNDPDGFVYAPEPPAGGARPRPALDTGLRDRLRARLSAYRDGNVENEPAGASVLDLRASPAGPVPELAAGMPPPPDPEAECRRVGGNWAPTEIGRRWEAPGTPPVPVSKECYVRVSNEDPEVRRLVEEGIRYLWEDGTYR